MYKQFINIIIFLLREEHQIMLKIAQELVLIRAAGEGGTW